MLILPSYPKANTAGALALLRSLQQDTWGKSAFSVKKQVHLYVSEGKAFIIQLLVLHPVSLSEHLFVPQFFL